MPLNLTKVYPQLLEIGHYNEPQRNKSLLGVFKRDIEDNLQLKFKEKIIRPVKGEEPDMVLLFRHLTTEAIEVNENGNIYQKRIFEMSRSIRLHWIKYHLEERKKEQIEVFSVIERDQKKRQDVTRTYIYDVAEKYVIVLDPQRSEKDYYLVTAYHLNKEYGEKKIKKLLRNKLSDIY